MTRPTLLRWSSLVLALCLVASVALHASELWFSTHGRLHTGPTSTAIVAFCAVVLLISGGWRTLAAIAALALGALWLLKPIVAPIMHNYVAYSYTSETHLYYVGPGAGLTFIGLTLVALRRHLASGASGWRWVVLLTTSLLAAVFLLLLFIGRLRYASLHILAEVIPSVAIFAGFVSVIALLSRKASQPRRDLYSYVHDPSMYSLLRAVASAPALAIDHADNHSLIGQRFGHFEIVELLGVGGMGRVFRTRDHRLLRDVALKLLPAHVQSDPDKRTMLLREAQALASVSHPAVTTIYDISVDGDLPFIAMELVDGATLRDKLRHGALRPEVVMSIAQQVAYGLAAAHARGVVHRDLKPDNIMISDGGAIKILDFGLAGVATLGRVAGTPGYMSPEQQRGDPLDPRSDIYAFGVTMHELCTGELSQQPARDNPRLPRAFADVLQGCIAIDPRHRYANGKDLAQALTAAATMSAVPTPYESAQRIENSAQL